MFHVPLGYAELAGGRYAAVAFRPGRKLWWRSFTEPRDATLLLRGAPVAVVGRVADGSLANEARTAYGTRFPRSARLLADAALVVFERAG